MKLALTIAKIYYLNQLPSMSLALINCLGPY